VTRQPDSRGVGEHEVPPELIEQLAQALARALIASLRRDVT
jgi:hypothetical protein